MEEYIYYLPDENGNKKEFKTNANSIIIVGANGSGKSRLGAWMEKECGNLYRIPAQRNTTISDRIIRYKYNEAKNDLFYGNINPYNDIWQLKFNGFENATIKLHSDYDKLLSYVLSYEQEQLRQEHRNGIRIENIIDKTKNIWKEIFPHRKIDLIKDEFLCIMNEQNKYKARMMSDGERAVLYLIMYVLCIEKKIILIDEPELHLHPSLTNRLWSVLEKHRQDCLFIYITHDLNFAANHIEADKFWIKSYNGQKWEIEKIEKNDIPQELFLKLLGARRDILFVEGKSESLDTKIYSILYPQYQIIPCSSCENVLNYTKTFNEQNALHGFNAYGIIDRDFRTQEEIDSANKNKVKVLEVAEVENLFLLECIILAILEQSDAREKFEEVKDYIFETKFKNTLQRQILRKLEKEIKHKLETININLEKLEQMQEKISSLEKLIDFENLHKDIENKFNSVYESKDYDELLKIFNQKGIFEDGVFLNKVGKTKGVYVNSVLKLLRENEELRKEVLKYIPSFTE
ncbi:AAA family ATPase [Campylobacter lari]|nr:AAA family ATPase [Campylobacter lari]